MPNVLNKFMQRGETDASSNAGNKLYSNVMGYLKEIKSNHTKNINLTEKIYQQAENSVQKLDQILADIPYAGISETEGVQKLLEGAELLKQQAVSQEELLKEVHTRQEQLVSMLEGLLAVEADSEEYREMQKNWELFEQRMEERLAGQEQQLKDTIQTEMSGQTEFLQNAIHMETASYSKELKKIGTVCNDFSEMAKMELKKFNQIDEMKQALYDEISDQREVISSVIQSELYGFRAELAEAVREEVVSYNTSVKSMYDGSKQTIKENLGDFEKEINKAIELAQIRMEDSLGEQLKSVQKVSRGYARMAMLASLLALLVLIADMVLFR